MKTIEFIHLTKIYSLLKSVYKGILHDPSNKEYAEFDLEEYMLEMGYSKEEVKEIVDAVERIEKNEKK